MKIIKKIKEYFKIRKRYNTLLLKYDIVKNELESKIIEFDVYITTTKKKQQVWETTLKEQEQEIIKLKKRKAKNEKDS